MAPMYSAPPPSRGSASSVALRGDSYTNHHTSAPYDDVVIHGNHHQPRGYTGPSSMYGNYPLIAPQPIEDNYGEDATRRKRVRMTMERVGIRGLLMFQIRKVHAAEQYVCVTCGRTDSPEWRKVRRLARVISLFNSCPTLFFRAHKGRKPFAMLAACDGQNKYVLNRTMNNLAQVPALEPCSALLGVTPRLPSTLPFTDIFSLMVILRVKG